MFSILRNLILVGALAGCTSLVPSTVAMLSKINPWLADPADYEIVVVVPPGLGLRRDSARLSIEGSYGDQVLSDSFVLQQVGVTDGGIALSVKPEDVIKIRAMREQFAAWEAADPVKSRGSISASVIPCKTGIPLPEDATVSISIRTEPGGALTPLLRPYPAQKMVDRIEADAGAPLDQC